MIKTQHYLFDWGDTLMVDLPSQTGSMCDWPKVQVVDGAKACLQRLSEHAYCHLATNAEDSSEAQIRLALKRAGLSDYIERIFCRENLGVGKTAPSYYHKITERLNVSPEHVTMIGDSLERDVHQALKAGIKVVWYNPNGGQAEFDTLTINKLNMLT
ncbi:HAD-IA family hydrolase [uncultured Paraglaciecola sp.]|jgi:FMN phosphatase YigB (HAD superfamily)|uniref:HAD family hydrolase n=1 Tax=uncultured Paraglaciecola sp. TaxID=1765024 RepID=UPI0025FBEA57|nr:HAD-IA family hydrolase [uncultured Paraglaciecola sp.]